MTTPTEELALPPLPKSLLNLIGEYGLARTDRVGEIERIHRWELLIAGIKDYAADYARADRAARAAAIPQEPAMDAEIECAALPAWNLGPYGTSAQDTVHPMFLAAFRAGYRACERNTPPVAAAPAHELAAALGWPSGISAEPADWIALLREVAKLRVAAPVADIGMVCKTAPERIWLQVDPEPEEDGQPVYQSDEVTWCSDKINESDTLYIRADLATKAVPAGEVSTALTNEQVDALVLDLLRDVDRAVRQAGGTREYETCFKHIVLSHIAIAALGTPAAEAEHHGLDNNRQVFFYEQDFYVLSNFSAFDLMWNGYLYATSEAAYHSEKFAEHDLRLRIMYAPSAHEAFKLAESWKDRRRKDWDAVKVDIMRDILRAKAAQHEYVRRKLLATGERELIENSWRDDYWGWGPNRDGKNMLGRLWMEVRAELREAEPAPKGDEA